MAERAKGGEVPGEVRQDGDDAADERDARAPERVEGGRDHLDGRVGGEAHGVAGEGARRLERRVLAEAAVLVDEADDGHAEQRQADHRRHREEQDHAQPAAQRPRERREVVLRGVARQVRERRRPHGDAEDADGQLHEAEGVAQPGDRAVGDEARERRVDDDVDLHGRHAERRGRHEGRDAPRAGIAQPRDRAAGAGGSPA